MVDHGYNWSIMYLNGRSWIWYRSIMYLIGRSCIWLVDLGSGNRTKTRSLDSDMKSKIDLLCIIWTLYLSMLWNVTFGSYFNCWCYYRKLELILGILYSPHDWDSSKVNTLNTSLISTRVRQPGPFSHNYVSCFMFITHHPYAQVT